VRGFEQIPWMYDAMCAVAEWRGMRRWRQWLAGGARVERWTWVAALTEPAVVFERGSPIGLDPSADASGVRGGGRRRFRSCARAPSAAVSRWNVRDVVCGLVFCSVPEPAQALAEVRRILRRWRASHVGTRACPQRYRRPPAGPDSTGLDAPRRRVPSESQHERTVEIAGFRIGEEDGAPRNDAEIPGCAYARMVALAVFFIRRSRPQCPRHA